MAADDGFLRLLAEMDPCDPFWDSVDEFIAAVQSIAEGKKEERGDLARQVERRVISLVDQFEQELLFFGRSDFPQLAKRTDIHYSSALADLHNLADKITQYREFDLSAADVNAARVKRAGLDALEESILGILSRLPSANAAIDEQPDAVRQERVIAVHEATGVQHPTESVQENALDKSPSQNCDPLLAAVVPLAKKTDVPFTIGLSRESTPSKEQGLLPMRNRKMRRALGRSKQSSGEKSSTVFAKGPGGMATNFQYQLPLPVCGHTIVRQSTDDSLIGRGANQQQTAACDVPNEGSLITTGDQTLVGNPSIETVTVVEAAEAEDVQVDSSDVATISVSWELLERGDLTGAYWLEVAENETETQFSRVIAALQASRWTCVGSQHFVEDLLAISETTVAPNTRWNPESLLRLSAGLIPSIVCPDSGMVAWLNDQSCPTKIRQFCSEITKFVQTGVVLQPIDLLQLQGSNAQERVLEQLSEKASDWLGTASSKTTKFWRTSRIWQKMVERGGPIHELLNPVARNQIRNSNDVKHSLNKWQQRQFVVQTIESLDKNRVGSNVASLPGSARDQLVRFIEEACALAKDWIRAVECSQSEDGHSWTAKHIYEVKATLESWLPELRTFNMELQQSSDKKWRIAANLFGSTLSRLSELFAMSGSQSEKTDSFDQRLQSLVDKERDLSSALAKRLLFTSRVQFSDEDLPVTQSIAIDDILSRPTVFESIECVFRRTWPLLPAQNGPVVTGA